MAKQSSFGEQMNTYRNLIDEQIEEYARQFEQQATRRYSQYSANAVAALMSVLTRGGKRIRGALAMAAYEMFGGVDTEVALTAALVMELVQTYLLVVDDVCDRGTVRRGGPTAHILLAEQHRKYDWVDDANHFGESIANLAAMLGMHEATSIIANMHVGSEIRVKAIDLLNYNLVVTIHGQFNDIYNQVRQADEVLAVEQVLEWKTAYYTFVNPLQFGAVLAGANDEALQSLVAYSLPAGRAFQLSDDLLGVFGEEEQTGKSPLDDIREGKRTLLMVEGLRRAEPLDRYFLEECLGNSEFNAEDLARCQRILEETGTRKFIDREIELALSKADESLELINRFADERGLQFLAGLLEYLKSRQS